MFGFLNKDKAETAPQETLVRTKDKFDVLMAEDSPTQAAFLEQLLTKKGYRVEVARNGQDALNYLKELQSDSMGWTQFRPDIIVSDIVMPVMDGFELCLTVKEHETFRTIPLILLTSLNDSKEALRGLYSGADNLIAKPFDPGHLLATIDTMLNPPKPVEEAAGDQKFAINIGGRKYMVTEERLRMINVIYATYETAVKKNLELTEAKDTIKRLEQQLAIARNALEKNDIPVDELLAHEVLVSQR